MTKEFRRKIYRKFYCRCAYCGKIIEYKDMQVDHLIPRNQGGTDDFDNLMPSCRRCNHYKRSYSLEDYREILKTLPERLMKNYINKVAIDYEIIKILPFDGVFYFEKIGEFFFKKMISRMWIIEE